MGQCLSAVNTVQTLVTAQDGKQRCAGNTSAHRRDTPPPRTRVGPSSPRVPPVTLRVCCCSVVLTRNDYELVIRASKDLEFILEAYLGAQGKGLHEKCTSVQHVLPPVRLGCMAEGLLSMVFEQRASPLGATP